MTKESIRETLRPLLSRIGPSLKRQGSFYKNGQAHIDQQRFNKMPRLEHAKGSDNPPRKGPDARGPVPGPSRAHKKRGGGPSMSRASSNFGRKVAKPRNEQPTLPEPLVDVAYLEGVYKNVDLSTSTLGSEWKTNPKSALSNFVMLSFNHAPKYEYQEGYIRGQKMFRTKVEVKEDLIGTGDAKTRKDSEKVAALSANYQIIAKGITKQPQEREIPKYLTQVTLSDGTVVNYQLARQFMDYYCRKFDFDQPDIDTEETRYQGHLYWNAVMTVGGRKIGIGGGKNKKDAQISCFLDVTQYLEKCDHELWLKFIESMKSGKNPGLSPRVYFQISDRLAYEINDLCHDIKNSDLYNNRPDVQNPSSSKMVVGLEESTYGHRFRRPSSEVYIRSRSAVLQKRREAYLADPRLDKMRQSRRALPVFSHAEGLLKHINEHEVTICMAATGSGKTTQIPQLILEQWIDREQGGRCNIVCTQPRRLAAISVAHRVAAERGEQVGKGSSVGYQVRFEAKFPDEAGSILFCTIGVFLRRMQNALEEEGDVFLDSITHILVDEAHERDIDTDLLLVVLKRIISSRRAKRKPLKVVLMSATIDPSLFQDYFIDEHGYRADVLEISGRSFPVQKQFLDDFLPVLVSQRQNCSWVFHDEKVLRYLQRELGQELSSVLGFPVNIPSRGQSTPRTDNKEFDDELEIPYPLVALTISHVIQISSSGHVLVFLPGWDDIQTIHRLLTDSSVFLGLNVADTSKFHIHLLHSTIPLAEQQKIFEDPPPGIRRIILSTNIAETSVTIPDVVYVVDTAKIKENRYDPERRISSLVSTWVGTSNLNQRAGRAGRHRPGDYYGILGHKRVATLHSHQLVEMKRMDLSNVVMHIKALNFPGMEVEDVLASTIEPPTPQRVAAAMTSLQMVGAIDSKKRLTALGKVLLQLPVEVQVGRLVLLGSFFRCLDQAVTIAAIMTNRDPFMSPPLFKREAQAAKNSWSSDEFRSDILASLKAYNQWWQMEKAGNYGAATRFCVDNYLSKSTLLTISKVKGHLLQAVHQAGIIEASTGGEAGAYRTKNIFVPSELNENGTSLPLLAALIASACQPKFAVRTSPMTYRTALEKSAAIHPSSVNHRKHEKVDSETTAPKEKQIFAFCEKRQNLSVAGQGPGLTYLVGCTRLDPMTYTLFGAHDLVATESGFDCDDWLSIVGSAEALDSIRTLKILMEGCLLRVFEGVAVQRAQISPGSPKTRRAEIDDKDEYASDEEGGRSPLKNRKITPKEFTELGFLTHDIVRILDQYSEERLSSHSRVNSRPATPVFFAPAGRPSGVGSGVRSGTSTPYNTGYDSRPGTPSRLSTRLPF